MPIIRRLDRADFGSCMKLAVSRGWGTEERKWDFLFRHSEVYGIDAPDGDGLAAATALTRYPGGLAAIGMVLVGSPYESQGLGRRIMTHVIEQAGDATVTLHATERGRKLYEKLGFRCIGTASPHKGRFQPSREDETDAEAIRPARVSDLPAIVALDAVVFGADRSHLLRQLPEFAERFVVAEDAGTVAGYAAAWRNNEFLVVGPVVADTTITARRLIVAAARDAAAPIRLDLRTDDPGRHLLPAWAAERGVTPGSLLALMVLGDRGLPGDDRRRYAPFSVALE